MTYEPFPSFQQWHLGFDLTVVDRRADQLRQKRLGATPQTQDRAWAIVTRAAAIETGAVAGLYSTDRGFTKIVATHGDGWQQALEHKGAHVQHIIEDAEAAYNFARQAVIDNTPITPDWVCQLHGIIAAHQTHYTVGAAAGGLAAGSRRPLHHGHYKTLPNDPTNIATGRLHYCAPPDETPSEMERFIGELATPEFQAAHPVVQAAYAHYACVYVHPFADGNGRVARALAGVFLYRSLGVPLVVYADQHDRYIDVLEATDAGRPGPLVGFFRDRVMDAIELETRALG